MEPVLRSVQVMACDDAKRQCFNSNQATISPGDTVPGAINGYEAISTSHCDSASTRRETLPRKKSCWNRAMPTPDQVLVCSGGTSRGSDCAASPLPPVAGIAIPTR